MDYKNYLGMQLNLLMNIILQQALLGQEHLFLVCFYFQAKLKQRMRNM